LRLLDIDSGSIHVDGINLSQVPRSIVRERCFVTVSQEPLLFADSTLRLNVDPSESLSNQTIMDTLVKVKLWQHFSIPEMLRSADNGENELNPSTSHPLLDASLSSLPTLSTGQKQLLSLARALLQIYRLTTTIGCRPVLLLDEATSSLDSDTEKILLDIVHQEWTCEHFTVIIISHKLSPGLLRTREEPDKVVLMADGRIQRVMSFDEAMRQGDEISAEDEVEGS
jgi:ATP-binding cassette, subfamily C (CFTR/MRP), member 1